MAQKGLSLVVLAAGKATRFKSDHSKVLHRLAGLPLGEYALRSTLALGAEHAFMIVGHEADEVRRTFARPALSFIEQRDQLGTGHALLVARPELERAANETVLVVVGDAPLLETATLRAQLETHARSRATATVLTTLLANPHGYGRILRAAGGRVRAIVEERVATPAQKKLKEVNCGSVCFSLPKLLASLGKLTNDNAQGEYLLTDLIAILYRHHEKVVAQRAADSRQLLGVNDRVELAQVEKILRLRKAEALMRDGVTLVDPSTTYIDETVEAGADTIIHPGVSLLGSTRLGRACVVEPYATIAGSVLGERATVRQGSLVIGCEIQAGATVGPFAHLRDGTVIEEGARIGNFVEVKKSRVGRGTKSLHLTYLGDATLGERVNIGAGTVTCNYDGEKKYPTTIEDGVFIGSGTMLVAPVRVGAGSYVAAGSTITEDVPPESLGIGRGKQVNKVGWVRERQRRKAEAAGSTGGEKEPRS